MKNQLRGFGLSFVMHTTLLLVIALMGSSVNISKPLVIDFSLEDANKQHDNPPLPKSPDLKARPQERTEKPQPAPAVSAREQVPQKRAEEPVMATSDTAPESQAPVAYQRPAPAVQPASASPPRQTSGPGSEGRTPSVQGQANTSEGMKQSYLKEHFVYIRNLVQKRLGYPAVARKMGWVGKVIISFVVCTDGHAKEITIKEGSGFEMLDKNAISAVQQASPFPRPPVEAQLIIPINYSLN